MAARAPAGLSRNEARRFGLVVGTAFLLLGTLLWWRSLATPGHVLQAIGTALLVFGLIVPDLLSPIYRMWMAGALAISKVTTPILMGVLYFGVLTPAGMLRRVFGQDPLRARRSGESLWVARAGEKRSAADMEHQF
jgi:membrane-bound ClpP family serine protease